MVLGVCGKYCAGKNQVAAMLAERGYRIVDVDLLGHEALEVMKNDIVAEFGGEILGPDRRIDRRALGGLVFRDRRKLGRLEGIVHPWMKARVREEAKRDPSEKVLVNAALLFTMGLDVLCDRIVVVNAPLCFRIRRALKRDRQSLVGVLGRVIAQRKLIPQPSFLPADTIIVENRGTLEQLKARVDTLAPRIFG